LVVILMLFINRNQVQSKIQTYGEKPMKKTTLTAIVLIFLMLTTELIPQPAQAGPFRGALGGAIVGGLVGGKRGARAGLVVGAIAGAARAKKQRDQAAYSQQQQLDMERRRLEEERLKLEQERIRLQKQRQ
jgi:uncharacterized protein YcfJ